jgi:hypothetical protein
VYESDLEKNLGSLKKQQDKQAKNPKMVGPFVFP